MNILKMNIFLFNTITDRDRNVNTGQMDDDKITIATPTSDEMIAS